MGGGRGGGHHGWRAPAAAVALALALATAAAAQVPRRCVPGSIGPGGCDSIRPTDADPGPLGIDLPPELQPPTGPLGGRATQRLGPRPEALRLDPLAPAPRDPAMGRDPRAVQSFQTPYVRDGRARTR